MIERGELEFNILYPIHQWCATSTTRPRTQPLSAFNTRNTNQITILQNLTPPLSQPGVLCKIYKIMTNIDFNRAKL